MSIKSQPRIFFYIIPSSWHKAQILYYNTQDVERVYNVANAYVSTL